MNTLQRIKVFSDRYPLIGPAMWVLSVQYFIIQVIVAKAWSTPFSVLHNTISDLGNTVCGSYNARFVCSPQHELMNVSFVMLGVTMAVGSMLIYHEFKKSVASYVGFGSLVIAGVGTVFVGLFPENTIGSLHLAGAAMPFFLGNAGLIVLGFTLRTPKSLRIYSVVSGIIALTALSFFLSGHDLGIGEGGMERVTAYPQTIWLIVFGLYMSRSHFRKISR